MNFSTHTVNRFHPEQNGESKIRWNCSQVRQRDSSTWLGMTGGRHHGTGNPAKIRSMMVSLVTASASAS
jgi:hypothetical protein